MRCWRRRSTGSLRTGACSTPRAWPESQRWRSCRRSPRSRKQPPERTANTRPQVSGAAAPPTGRSGVAHRPGAGANWSSRDSDVANNREPIQANDLTSQSSGFIVNKRGTHCLANDSLSFTPVHPRIRAIRPQDLHLWKGRGPWMTLPLTHILSLVS